MTILVFGATGNTGSAIVKQLKAKQVGFCVMATSKDKAAALELSENQIRVGNFDDIPALVAAMTDMTHIYLVMPVHPKTVHWVENVITAAKTAKVQHIVKQSGLNANASAKSQVIRDHAATDALIQASGLDYTLIQPNSFFQNFYGSLPTINGEGRFFLPLGDAKLSLVDIHDVAAVAVAALTEPGHAGKTHLLTGPEALTSAEQATLLSKASGKEITYVDVPKEGLEAALKSYGMDAWQADKLSELLAWFAQGNYDQVSTTIEMVLGRKPRAFSDFAQELAHSIHA